MKMKISISKIICTSLFVSASLLPVQAQKMLRFGVKGGYELADRTFKTNMLDVDNRTGYYVGAVLDARFPIGGLGASVGALYTVRNSSSSSTVSLDKTYLLEIPVNLNYRIGLGSVAVVLSAGPYVGFTLDGGNINFQSLSDTYEARMFQAGANFGVGVDLGEHFHVGVSYQTALTDNYKNNPPESQQVFRQRPDRMSLTGTVYF